MRKIILTKTFKRINVAFPKSLVEQLKRYMPPKAWNEFIVGATQKALEETRVAQKIAPSKPTERVVYRRLWWAGLLAAALATVSNMVIYVLASLFGVSLQTPVTLGSTDLAPLPFVSVLLASLMPAVGAALLLALVGVPLPLTRQIIPRPGRFLGGVAAFFLLFSFSGPLGLPAGWPVKLWLGAMHTATAIIIVTVLTVISVKRPTEVNSQRASRKNKA